LSSFTEITSPTRIPLKFTLPPVAQGPAAGPSKTMRSGLRRLGGVQALEPQHKAKSGGDHRQGEGSDQNEVRPAVSIQTNSGTDKTSPRKPAQDASP